MKTKKYTTSKIVGIGLLLVGLFSWTVAVFSSPSGFKIDSVVLILVAILAYGFFDLLWGTYVTLDEKVLSRVDNFIFRKNILISNVEAIRYQPTYGVVKEASSLYVFEKGHGTATFTMTSLWFTEKALRDFLQNLKKLNPAVILDDEAQKLMGRDNTYFEAQKIQPLPFAVGVVGVIVGILLFIKFQPLNSVEFNLTNHGLISLSAGLIAGFGIYTLTRRSLGSLFVGTLASGAILALYWFIAGV